MYMERLLSFYRATDLAGILIALEDKLADAWPIGAVFIGIIIPQPSIAQVINCVWVERNPVTGGAELGGR